MRYVMRTESINVVQIKPKYKTTLESKIEQFRLLDRELKALTERHKKLKQTIVEEMGSDEKAFDQHGHVIATLTEQTRNLFDKEKFEAFHPNEYSNFVKQIFSKVFRLK